jgi:hypothetical protein
VDDWNCDGMITLGLKEIYLRLKYGWNCVKATCKKRACITKVVVITSHISVQFIFSLSAPRLLYIIVWLTCKMFFKTS